VAGDSLYTWLVDPNVTEKLRYRNTIRGSQFTLYSPRCGSTEVNWRELAAMPLIVFRMIGFCSSSGHECGTRSVVEGARHPRPAQHPITLPSAHCATTRRVPSRSSFQRRQAPFYLLMRLA
jgi:hypothetical protein